MINLFRLFKDFNAFLKLNEEDKKLVLFLEKQEDIIYFDRFLTDLFKIFKQKIIILISNNNNLKYLEKLKYVEKVIYISDGLCRFLYFRLIKTKIFFLTTPDLGNSELKRSINDVKYFYVFHSIFSSHTIYNFKAFDNYDYILSVGPHHDKEIKASEKIFKGTKKAIIPFGYPRLIDLNEKYKYRKSNQQKKSVLIAPTWGESSITENCLEKIFQNLLNLNLNISFRPHPRSILEKYNFLKKMERKYHNYINFQYDITSTKFLNTVDILISDWSGFAFEFYFTTKKKIIFIDTPQKIRNINFSRFNIIPLEQKLRPEIGTILPIEKIEEIGQVIKKLVINVNKTFNKDQFIYDYKKNFTSIRSTIKNILKDG